jgi:hypothetical protein
MFIYDCVWGDKSAEKVASKLASDETLSEKIASKVHDKFIGPSKDIQDENIKINKIAKESYEAGVKRYNEKDYKGALDNF